MAIQHKIGLSWQSKNAGASPVTEAVTLAGDGEDNRDVDVDANVTANIDLTLTVANLVLLVVDVTAAMTVKFKNSGADISLSMLPGQPLFWTNVSHLTNPLARDVTSLQIVCGAAPGSMTLRALSQTP